jgi:hypothetical protein
MADSIGIDRRAIRLAQELVLTAVLSAGTLAVNAIVLAILTPVLTATVVLTAMLIVRHIRSWNGSTKYDPFSCGAIGSFLSRLSKHRIAQRAKKEKMLHPVRGLRVRVLAA